MPEAANLIPFDLTPQAPALWDVENEAYHADTSRVSHSALEQFRKKPCRYRAIYLDGTIKRAPTRAMNLGSAFHMYKLEPTEMLRHVVGAPVLDRRTKAGRAAWVEFQEQNAGKLILPADDIDKLKWMRDAMLSNPDAVALLNADGAVREMAITFNDPITGLPLKVKPDQRMDDRVVDIKTSQSCGPEAFARVAANFGYHRQAALYQLGAELLTGMVQYFFHIVVETTDPPFECAVYQIHPEDLERAVDQNTKLLKQLLACAQSGDWRSPHAKQAQQIRLPAFAFSSEAYEIY